MNTPELEVVNAWLSDGSAAPTSSASARAYSGGAVNLLLEGLDPGTVQIVAHWAPSATETGISDSAAVTTISLDIDVDSDNTGEVDGDAHEELLENAANELGARIFVNTDDDNQNGRLDSADGGSDYYDIVDNDLAQINLKIDCGSLTSLAGYEFRLTCSDGLKLYSSPWKDGIEYFGDGQTRFEECTGGYKLILGSTVSRFNGVIWAEGTVVGPQTVTWSLLKTATNAVIRQHTVKINVESIVWPSVNQTHTEDWQNRPTIEWDGIALAAAWSIDKALVDYITAPNDKGSIETIRPDMNGGTTASADGADSTVQLTDAAGFANGFTMEFDYSFDRERGDGTTGWVSANGKPDRLSYVGNSGVKFGTAMLGADLKDFEIAILDVTSMVSVAGGLETGIGNDGNVSVNGYQPESLNKLMTGVRYGGDYRYMNDWGNGDALPTTGDGYHDILSNNTSRANTHIKIDLAREDDTFTVTVYLDYQTQWCYRETGIALQNYGTILLQSHWGSGVIFSNMQTTKA